MATDRRELKQLNHTDENQVKSIQEHKERTDKFDQLNNHYNKDNRLLCKQHSMFRPVLKSYNKSIFQLVSFFRLSVIEESERKLDLRYFRQSCKIWKLENNFWRQITRKKVPKILKFLIPKKKLKTPTTNFFRLKLKFQGLKKAIVSLLSRSKLDEKSKISNRFFSITLEKIFSWEFFFANFDIRITTERALIWYITHPSPMFVCG